MDRAQEGIKRFKTMMNSIEQQIVRDTKEIKKLLKEIDKAKGINTEDLWDRVHTLETRIKNYTQVIEDLKYAIVNEYNDHYAARIVKQAHLSSREEYLMAKARGVQPSLVEIVDIISNRMIDIDSYYMRDDNGQLKRNDDMITESIRTDSTKHDTISGQTHFGYYDQNGMKYDENWNAETWLNEEQMIANNRGVIEGAGMRRKL